MKQSFSQRNGLVKVEDILQINDASERLRNGVFNAIADDYLQPMIGMTSFGGSEFKLFMRKLWKDFYRRPLTEMPDPESFGFVRESLDFIRSSIIGFPWYFMYDLIEFLIDLNTSYTKRFIKECNQVLERENSGFRIIDGTVAPITDEIEISEIKTAIENGNNNEARTHLNQALKFLSDKKKPSYKKAIAESMMAVEAVCREITGKPSATLSEALKIIDKTSKIHPTMIAAFQKLYAYTGDESGIRHALKKDDREVSSEDALFFVVTCSAFINYLNVKRNK